jgi:endonuclease I
MIYANHLYNLATSKPRISMAEIEAACIDKAKQGEFHCWVLNPIAEKDIERLRMNGFQVEKHNNASYRIDWSNPTNL